MNYICWLIVVISLPFFVSGCVRNEAFRVGSTSEKCLTNIQKCNNGNSIIEEYENYDLTFIEFTERGNLFDRSKANQVYKHISEKANQPQGAAVIVFVHGWKHNAKYDDTNIKDFKSPTI